MDKSERFCSRFLDQLTGHVQGAFAVVENGFYDVIEELHAHTLQILERVVNRLGVETRDPPALRGWIARHSELEMG